LLASLSPCTSCQVVWRASLEEAFANAVENMAQYVVRSSAHTLFFGLNSYMRYSPKVRPIVEDSIRHFGIGEAFRLLFLSYAAANLLAEDSSKELRARIMDIASLTPVIDDPGSQDAGMAMGRIGFTLSSVFRSSTAKAYFRLINHEEAFEEVQGDGFRAERAKEPLRRLSHLFASLAIPQEEAQTAAA
jgi:hypothetical protein